MLALSYEIYTTMPQYTKNHFLYLPWYFFRPLLIMVCMVVNSSDVLRPLQISMTSWQVLAATNCQSRCHSKWKMMDCLQGHSILLVKDLCSCHHSVSGLECIPICHYSVYHCQFFKIWTIIRWWRKNTAMQQMHDVTKPMYKKKIRKRSVFSLF